MRNKHVKTDDDEFEVKFAFAQKRLLDLLQKFDQIEGFEIVALHIDQALNTLKEIEERKTDQSDFAVPGCEKTKTDAKISAQSSIID